MNDSQRSLIYSKASNQVIAKHYAQTPDFDVRKAYESHELMKEISTRYFALLNEYYEAHGYGQK